MTRSRRSSKGKHKGRPLSEIQIGIKGEPSSKIRIGLHLKPMTDFVVIGKGRPLDAILEALSYLDNIGVKIDDEFFKMIREDRSGGKL